MNKIFSSLAQTNYRYINSAIAILIGYSIGGFYLSSYQASIPVWAIVYLLIAYTSITGKGGVILSAAGFSNILITYALVHPWPKTNAIPLPLTSAQLWSGTLLVLWLLGILLILLLGSAVTKFARHQRLDWRYKILFWGLSSIALTIGHRFHIAIFT